MAREPLEPVDGVEFFVAGEARPAGSKVAGVVTRIDPVSGQRVPVRREAGGWKTFTKDSSGQKGEQWRADVRAAAQAAMGDRPMFTGPVGLEVTFYRARPKSHYRTGRHAGELRGDAATYPTSRPDVTKLLRAVEDALTGLVWPDDSQVVSLEASKRWAAADRVGARVGVWPAGGADGTAALSSPGVPELEGAQLF